MYPLGPFHMEQVHPSRIFLLSGGSLSWSRWVGRWQVRVRSDLQTQVQTEPAVLYGAVRWKWTACPFRSDCPPIRWSDGKHIAIRLFSADFIGSDARRVSTDTFADTRCPIENNGWSYRVHLKNWQTDLIDPLVGQSLVAQSFKAYFVSKSVLCVLCIRE